MTMQERVTTSLLQYTVISLLFGCGDAFITELRTSDGRIRITIIDPSDCDQSRIIYGTVAGVTPQTQFPPKFGLRGVACGNRIDANSFLLLEGANWCAVVDPESIPLCPTEPLGAVSLIIDRTAGQIYYDDATSFSKCPMTIRESVSLRVKTYKRE